MHVRSTAEVVAVFLIGPILFGAGLLGFAAFMMIDGRKELSLGQWLFQIGFLCMLGLGLLTALPAVGWQELRKRRQQREAARRGGEDSE